MRIRGPTSDGGLTRRECEMDFLAASRARKSADNSDDLEVGGAGSHAKQKRRGVYPRRLVMAKRFLAVVASVAAGGGLGVRLRRRCARFRSGELGGVHLGLDTRCGRLRRGHFEELASVGALHGLSGGHARDVDELGFLRVGAVDHVGTPSDRRAVGEVLFWCGRCWRRRGCSRFVRCGQRIGARRGRDARDRLLDGDVHAGRATNRRVNPAGSSRRALGSDIGSDARCG